MSDSLDDGKKTGLTISSYRRSDHQQGLCIIPTDGHCGFAELDSAQVRALIRILAAWVHEYDPAEVSF